MACVFITYRLGQLSFAVLAALLLLLVGFDPVAAQGFHNGGAGNCSGCHSVHSAPATGSQLLLASDPSSICLNCHAGAGGVNSPAVFSANGSALTPGGDFYWLTRDFSWSDGNSPGYTHGHNIVARDYNLYADPLRSHAPGGSYPSISLGCTSCHDPHGRSNGGTRWGAAGTVGSGSYGEDSAAQQRGAYRLLGDDRYQPPGGAAFQNAAPIARQSSINRFAESDGSHVDYGSGMSEWCANCHGDLLFGGHQVSGSSFSHPSGRNARFDLETINLYNSYLRTGDLSGTAVTAYLQFVPFERGTTDVTILDPHSRQGPDANANVMCLSCHRAHASAFPYAGRWDFSAELLVGSHPAVGDGGASASDTYYSYYGRDIAAEFGSGQRGFCEKCHGEPVP